MPKLSGKAKAKFLKRMAKGRKAAKGKLVPAQLLSFGKQSRGGGRKDVAKLNDKQYIAWLKAEIKMRTKNPTMFSSDYSQGELRGYKEALKKLTK